MSYLLTIEQAPVDVFNVWLSDYLLKPCLISLTYKLKAQCGHFGKIIGEFSLYNVNLKKMQAGTLTWHLKKQKHKLISNVDWKDYTNKKTSNAISQ